MNYSQLCHVCGKESRIGFTHRDCAESTYLDGLFYVCGYDATIEKLITDGKYGFSFDIFTHLGMIMSEFSEMFTVFQNAILTSVPLHNFKYRYRGFNQAEILAKEIARKRGFRYRRLLKRVRNTKTQVGMGENERMVNLKEAFAVIYNQKSVISEKNEKQSNQDTENCSLKTVVLIDDVYTTGTTLNECANVLKKAGWEKVYGFTFAKSRV